MTPRTEAGRALLEHMTEDAAGFVVITSGRFTIRWVVDALARDIPAIEAEAIAAREAELVAAVKRLPESNVNKPGAKVNRAAVLSLIRGDS